MEPATITFGLPQRPKMPSSLHILAHLRNSFQRPRPNRSAPPGPRAAGPGGYFFAWLRSWELRKDSADEIDFEQVDHHREYIVYVLKYPDTP